VQVYVFHTLTLKAVLAANEKLKQLEEQLIPHIVRYQLKPRRSVGETEAATLAARHSPSGGNLMGLEGSMADMSLSSSFSSALGGGSGGVGGFKPEWYCCTYLAPAGSFCQRANTLQGYADVNRCGVCCAAAGFGEDSSAAPAAPGCMRGPPASLLHLVACM
jgi:hypothetical protein